MSTFLRMLWSGRDRPQPNPAVQERLAVYTLHPARNVMAAPQRCPIYCWHADRRWVGDALICPDCEKGERRV